MHTLPAHPSYLDWIFLLFPFILSFHSSYLPPFFPPSSGTPHPFSRLCKMRPITSSSLLATILNLIASGSCQFPPTPKGLTKLESRLNADIYISYKEVRLSYQERKPIERSQPIKLTRPSARNMRDNSWGQVLRRLFTFTSWDVDGCISVPELFHE